MRNFRYVFNLSTFKYAGASCSVDSSMTALLYVHWKLPILIVYIVTNNTIIKKKNNENATVY